MPQADTIKFIVAMIIMLNPLGSLSIFLQLTKRLPHWDQRKIAMMTTVAIAIIMLITVWTGKAVLSLLGISIPSFRFAGGIILLLMGLSMLQSRESPVSHTSEDDDAVTDRHSIAIVPLALPIIIGPGAISTIIITVEDFPLFFSKLWMSVICFLLASGMGALLYFAHPVAKFVGASTMKAITRIMGMIIMAIAVEMLAAGLTGLIPALH